MDFGALSGIRSPYVAEINLLMIQANSCQVPQQFMEC